MSIMVLVPTRGRPDAMHEAARSLVNTRECGCTTMMAVIDADDPFADEYIKGANLMYDYIIPAHPEGKGMVAALNAAAKEVMATNPEPTIFGFIGDDHRFRTKGWDTKIEQTLKRPGYAYGYDGFWHKGEIPTQIFISRQIVFQLGYMALPDCFHLYVDNAWRELAEATSSLHYLPDVLVEHMHPAIGKAEWDEGHKRVNTEEMYSRDRAAFEAWRASPRFTDDVKRVQRALGPATIATR